MRSILLASLLGWAIMPHSLTAQTEIRDAFQEAYAQNPIIPNGLLEGMAYANSRMQNITHDEDQHDHLDSERFGLFAVVEDGQGYYDNSLDEICRFTGIAPETYKADPVVQILFTAPYIAHLCQHYNVHELKDAAPVVKAFSEFKSTDNVNRFAQELYAYEVYYHLTHGFETPETGIAPQAIKPWDWFSANAYRLVSGAQLTLWGDVITDGVIEFQESDSTPATKVVRGFEFAVPESQDYGPALQNITPCNWSSRNGVAISAVTIHTTQGSYAGAIAWFHNCNSQVSAHYVMRSSDGQVTQTVLESKRAWHVASENLYTVGIEHEGYVNNPAWYTAAMYASSAALTRDICTGYNINTTTCYNGPAHAGVHLLAASYRIKGHQHFPNQTHTDPGIYWNWANYYNLVNNLQVACNTPAGLATPNLTPNSARLTWGAVAGASNYSIRYRVLGVNTWLTVTTTNNSYFLNGLSANATYEWQLSATCAQGLVSPYSSIRTFTTKPMNSSDCTGSITDSGGNAANYGNNENWTYTIAPTGAGSVELTFSSFGLEANYDYLYIYDGANVNAPLIGTYTGQTSPGTITSTGGALTLRFVSDGATVSWGFVATWDCAYLPPCTAPINLTTNSLSYNSATVGWSNVLGAVSYTVQIRPSGGLTWTSYTANTNSFTFTGLTGLTTYNWQVRTNCNGNASSDVAGPDFTTTAPPCPVATGLTTTGISTTVATLNWVAAAGATGYVVEYKPTAGVTWTSLNVTGVTRNLTGLTASTGYQWRMRTNCGNGNLSGYSSTMTFTTRASCYDAYEPNNYSYEANLMANGQSRLGKICPSGDVDWFRVTTNATSTIVFTLTQVPVDYDLELYGGVNVAYITGSYNGAQANETITRNAAPAGSYYYRVYGAGGVTNSLLDYRVAVTVTPEAPEFGNEPGVVIEPVDAPPFDMAAQALQIPIALLPNPATEYVTVAFDLAEDASGEIILTDIMGNEILSAPFNALQGSQQMDLDLQGRPAGMYLVTVRTAAGIGVKRLVVGN